eukprot:GFUD01005488.1.p2 GENE.GFUD01005488.1~~GFUD01005488.1.p2  ORF type:complete len:177 (+),score=62.84 GFUD01005488.1:68-598(+)
MYLLLWGSFLSLCSILVSPLVKLLIHFTCNISQYEISLRKSIRDMKKDLSKISMQDQFALYAKTERKINKLSAKLSSCTSARSVQLSKASWAFTITFHAILGLALLVTMWSYGGTPVLVLPPAWTFPLTWPLSLPTGVPGGVGLPLWMGLTSAAIKVLPSFPAFGMNKEYSQLPLD